MNKETARLAISMPLFLPLLAIAQGDPADGTVPVPALSYSSAFADYQRWRDIPAGDWRAMNDALRGARQVGAQAPAARPAPPAATASAPTLPANPAEPAAHEGNHRHGRSQ